MKRHYFWLMSLLAIAVFAACNKKNDTPFDPAKQAAIDEQLITDYISKNSLTGVMKDDTSVLRYKILANGISNDTIKLNERMNITYTGKLLNGTQFDSGTKTTLSDLRLEDLVKGWQIGLRKISKGGKVLLIIPSALGYGNRAAGSIPANSVLVFEITLHDFYY